MSSSVNVDGAVSSASMGTTGDAKIDLEEDIEEW